MESCLRLRLAFKNGGYILSETQRSQGLKKSWILLEQQLQTIADLSAYIIQTFHLHQSCPHGLLLSMNGFVLPPFEPICILKDKDIIRVKKKGDVLLIEESDAANNVEEMQIVEKQPANCGALLLANEEFENESGGYQSEESDDESEEDEGNGSDDTEHLESGNAISKKRKASEELQDSKKKKQRQEPPQKKVRTKRIKNSHQGVPSRKKSAAKKKLSKHENAAPVKTNAGSAEESDQIVESTPSMKRNEELQKDGKDIGDATPVSESARKLPSRSARRKYAKRKWLREMAKIQKKGLDSSSKEVQNWKQAYAKAGKRVEVDQPKGLQNWKQAHATAERRVEVGQPKGLLHWKQFGQKDVSKTSGKNEQHNQKGIVCHRPIQNGNMEDEVVPITIRPRHIRFEPLEEDQAVQQSQETFQWNGIASKKKGQKWGTNRCSVSQRDDYRESKEHAVSIEKYTHLSEPMDFDKLPPLPNVPEEGDVIAYRLIQLSSTWTPEISSYQVGKVLWYNPKSGKVVLMPIQEFPIDSDKSNEDESSAWQPDNTLYEGDGSFEIDFRSLLDVRVINNANVATANTIPHGASTGLLGNRNSETSAVPSSNNKHTNGLTPETGGDNHGKSVHALSKESGVNVWEQFSEAINAKKEELSKENGWGKVSSGRSSWSFSEAQNAKKEELLKENGWGKASSGRSSWSFSEALNGKKEERSKENGWGKASSGRSSWSFRASKGTCSRPSNGLLNIRKTR